jgi:hypothetical protein
MSYFSVGGILGDLGAQSMIEIQPDANTPAQPSGGLFGLFSSSSPGTNSLPAAQPAGPTGLQVASQGIGLGQSLLNLLGGKGKQQQAYASAPVSTGFDFMSILPFAGLGLLAFLLLRKKK